MRRTVEVLTTGGTIATREFDGRSKVSLDGTALVGKISPRDDVELVIRDICRTPSWMFDSEMMHTIAHAASQAAKEPGVDGVVVTHGTTTLEYTAFLTDLYLDATAPVVFTGAMRPADSVETDGPRNLSDAIAVASDKEARGLGSVVCFGGQLIAARDAWKLKRTSLDAFVGLHGSIGTIDDGEPVIRRRPVRVGSFPPRVEKNVALVKAFPGCDGSSVDAVVGSGARGLVLEGLPGGGGLPPKMHDSVRRASEQGILVVLASRAPVGRISSVPTGGTGEPLADMKLLSAGDLTAEKAWVLLMVVLGQGGNHDDSVRQFRLVAG